jgi:hypothetical protein
MRTCAACGESMPPPASRGRPAVYCSLQCRRDAEYGRKLARTPPRTSLDVWRRQRADQEAEDARRAEQEYQKALKAGGDVAAEAKWWRLYSAESRYGLCQWALPSGRLGACTNRTTGVFCAKHNREVERRIEKRRGERVASLTEA